MKKSNPRLLVFLSAVTAVLLLVVVLWPQEEGVSFETLAATAGYERLDAGHVEVFPIISGDTTYRDKGVHLDVLRTPSTQLVIAIHGKRPVQVVLDELQVDWLPPGSSTHEREQIVLPALDPLHFGGSL